VDEFIAQSLARIAIDVDERHSHVLLGQLTNE
jgi:hypothetical protein